MWAPVGANVVIYTFHVNSKGRRLLPSLLAPHQPKSYKDTGGRVEPSDAHGECVSKEDPGV
jgi:hypothetical protein